MLMLFRRVCVTCAWFCTLKIPEKAICQTFGLRCSTQIVEAVTVVVVVVGGGGGGVVSLRFQD